MKRVGWVVTATWSLCAMVATSAGANLASPQILDVIADPYFPPNEDASEVFVVGDASFGGENPVTVGQDGPGDADRRELGLFGMDARNLAIWQPNLDVPELTFVMSLYDFQLVAPEAAAWRWTFNLDGVPYRLEAARGGATLPSTLDGGLATLGTIGGDVFRLLGPCNADATACPYYGPVDGAFDENSDWVQWIVPLEGPFRAGAAIAPHPDGAHTSFGAGPATMRDRVTQTETYTLMSRRVEISVETCTIVQGACAPGGTRVIEPIEAFLPTPERPDAQPFWANLSVQHLNRGPIGPTVPFEVLAKPCAGANCGVAVSTIVWL